MTLRKGPNDAQRLALSEVDLGLACVQFAQSQVGIYLIDRSKEESAEAVDKLKTVDPEDSKAIRDLQTIIWRADTFEKYLTDAILGGRNAEEQLKHTTDNSDGE